MLRNENNKNEEQRRKRRIEKNFQNDQMSFCRQTKLLRFLFYYLLPSNALTVVAEDSLISYLKEKT